MARNSGLVSELGSVAGISWPGSGESVTAGFLDVSDHGPHREIVLTNAAAALVVAGHAADLLDGARLAAKSIDSGAARERLDAFVAFSQKD